MRLLHTIHSLSPEGGGPAEGLLRLAEAARSSGSFDSEVICLDPPAELYQKSEALPVHALGPGWGKFGYTPRLDRWFVANLTRFDGLVIHGLWQYESLAAWKACRNGLPYVVFTHGMLDPWFQEAYPLKHLKKVLYWRTAQYRVLRDASAVLFTASLEAELARTAFRPNQWNSVVVPFGTVAPGGNSQQQIQHFEAACPEVRGKSFILFLGRLHEKKGCDLLIEAFARSASDYPEADLVMAGPDDRGYQAVLASLAAGVGVGGRVHFPGMLRGDAKWGAFRAAEVFALPSHQENFGIAVAEALACGTPVLISNKVNIWREIAEDGVGFVDDDTVDGAIRLLTRWRETPTAARLAMAAKCQTTFEQRFDIAKLPQVIADLFATKPEPRSTR
jgi:glycosyltransferase involved in cell wall biosynthesis